MLARIQLTIAAALVLVAVALAGVLAFGGSGEPVRRAAFTVGPGGFAGAQSPDGARAEDFNLRDQDGAPASIAAERGKVTVLTFLYTTCKDTCPIAASQILGALDDLGPAGRDVAALAVSVDPENDTASRARSFLLDRRLTGRMRFALGTEAQLAPVWKDYAVRPQGDDPEAQDYEHSARVVLIDKRGFQRSAFPLSELTPPALAHDLRRLLAEPA